MRSPVIGIMGPGETATPSDCQVAFELGRQSAQQGWIVLTGGRNVGVMEAASRGAKQAGGITIGILPGRDRQGLSDAVDIPIVTNLGNARNAINVLSSDVVIACGGGPGTLSEIALSLKEGKDVVLLNQPEISQQFFGSLLAEHIFYAETPEAAIAIVETLLIRKKP